MPALHESSTATGEAQLPKERFFDLIGRIATGDAKLVIANRFAAVQGDSYKAWDFTRSLEEIVPEGWIPNWRTISGYCELSLEPAEVVKRTGGEGPYGSRYQATHYGASIGLGLGGVVNEWSLQTPELSTHQVFGINNHRGDQGTAERRYLTLSYLLGQNSAVSACDIVDDLDQALSLNAVEKQIHSLQQGGLVAHTSKEQTYNPMFTLAKPQPKYGLIKQASTRRLYETLQTLYSNDVREISLDDLLECTLEGAEPDIDPTGLRKDLIIAAARERNIPCLSAQQPPEQRRSRILLKDEFREPVQSLIAKLEDFRASPNQSAYQEKGLEIVSDGASIRQLFDKWERTSSKVKHANKQEVAANKSQIASIVSALGTASLPEVYSAFEEQGSGLSRATIKDYMKDMVNTGALASHQIRMNRTKKRVREVFEVVAPNEATQA